MIHRIARKEFIETLRDKRFIVSALIIGGLLFVSLALGWKHSSEMNREHEAAENATQTQWNKQGLKTPHGGAHFGVYAFKPQMPLSFIDRGIESFTGSAVWLEAHKQNDFRYRPASDQSSLTRFGELTAAVVLQLLLPLLIILLAFNAFAGERESGTLRQVLSLGVNPKSLAFGKVLGLTSILALLLIPAVIAGVAAMNFAQTDVAFGFDRFALLSIAYLFYLGIFVAVSLGISAVSKSSRFALLLLLALWIFGCLIAPRIAADFARSIYPTPSAMEFVKSMEDDIKNGADSHNPADKRLADLKAEMLTKYGVKDLKDLPINFDGIALQASEDYGNRVFDEHYGEVWDKFLQQDNLRQIGGIFAPILAVSSLSRGLAGTDFAQQKDFAVAAENHRRLMIRTVNNHVMQNVKYGDTKYMIGNELWSQVPQFQYQGMNTASVLRQQTVGISILTFWFAAAVLFMLWSVGKMRVQ